MPDTPGYERKKMSPKIELKHSKGRTQRIVNTLWPLALLTMIVFTPLLVLQSYRRTKEK
jgi:hypothetical protein